MKRNQTRNKTIAKAAIAVIIAASLLMMLLAGCAQKQPTTDEIQTQAQVRDKPYSEALEKRLAQELSNDTKSGARPDYLPAGMFINLPEFPQDFYAVRNLVRLGRIADLGNLEEKYWMQPEFFPGFEESGLTLLQNPPEGRWGAYGIATYPADSVSTIVQGESVDLFFFIKSSYLVETYQGINLVPVFPEEAAIASGVELPDGARSVKQDSTEVKKHIEVKVEPNPFILEPNFPIYRTEGTKRIKVTLTAAPDTPPGDYVVALDTGDVPEAKEKQWLLQYLNLYTSGGMTKIDRPYYQAFIMVVENENAAGTADEKIE